MEAEAVSGQPNRRYMMNHRNFIMSKRGLLISCQGGRPVFFTWKTSKMLSNNCRRLPTVSSIEIWADIVRTTSCCMSHSGSGNNNQMTCFMQYVLYDWRAENSTYPLALREMLNTTSRFWIPFFSRTFYKAYTVRLEYRWIFTYHSLGGCNCLSMSQSWYRSSLSPWWRHQMKTFSTLLAICAGNSPVPELWCVLG